MFYSKKIISVIMLSLLVTTLILSSCSRNPVTTPVIENTVTATQEVIPTKTPTSSPTLQPSPTLTIEPTPIPTATPIPELELVDDNLIIWSIRKDNLVMISYSGISKDSFSTTYDGYLENDVMNIRIPASAVIVEAEFNQPITEEIVFNIYDVGSDKSWYTSEITPDPETPTKGYFLLKHNFLLDPPFWEITYTGKLENLDGKVFWEKNLRLFKLLPNSCWDGSIPDPVTLYCPNYDGDWNYRDFPNFNPNADIFTSGQVELGEEYED